MRERRNVSKEKAKSVAEYEVCQTDMHFFGMKGWVLSNVACDEQVIQTMEIWSPLTVGEYLQLIWLYGILASACGRSGRLGRLSLYCTDFL